MEDAAAEVETALKVAVLKNQEVPQAEIAERLGITAGEVRAAVKRLGKIAERIDRDDEPQGF